jgi:SPP1 gp7 family putative phage head morphogenesis protein
MVAFARTQRESAELAADYAVAASEGAVRAERYRRPLEDAADDCMRALRRLVRAQPPMDVLRRGVAAALDAYTLAVERQVGLALRREGAWSQQALEGIWDDLTPSPLIGGEFREARTWWLLEARESKTSKYLRIIKSGDHEERMRRWSTKLKKVDPVAELIASGIARGAKLDTIAKRVQPYVKGYISSAMRIVRTETARVHNQLAEETFKEHKDEISGFQILSQLDARVRPAHAARHGRVYPKGRKRPSLPDAPNCRCYYAPVLKKNAKKFEVPGSRTFDTTTYDKWFSSQEDWVKINIVGKTRWQIVKSKGIRVPKWQDFSNLRSGNLLSIETLKRMNAKEIKERRKKG